MGCFALILLVDANVASQGFDESNEVSVVHQFGQDQNPDASFEINASTFAAFPSLLSSSPSLTALGSVCSDLDAFDFFTSRVFSTAASTDDGNGKFFPFSICTVVNHRGSRIA